MPYALSAELAAALEEAAHDDGCHLGPTDATIAALALRQFADKPRLRLRRRRRIVIAAACLALGALNPIAYGIVDFNRDGVIDADDLRALADKIQPQQLVATSPGSDPTKRGRRNWIERVSSE